MARVRDRNPKQLLIDAPDLLSLSRIEDRAIVMSDAQYCVVGQLLDFYAHWKTLYASRVIDQSTYEVVSDSDFDEIDDIISSFPLIEVNMSDMLDRLDNITEAIAALCDCIGAVISQSVADNTSALIQQLASMQYIAMYGKDAVLPVPGQNADPGPTPSPKQQGYDSEWCKRVQALFRWATDIMRYVMFDLEYESLVSAGVIGLLTLIPPTAGLIVPLAVALAVTAIAMSHFWQVADQQDFQEIMDSKDEIVCIIYNAESSDAAQSALEEYADDAGWNASVKVLFKSLFCAWAMNTFFAGLWEEVDTTGLNGDFCEDCAPEPADFTWVGSPGGGPWPCGVYDASPPYRYRPTDEGCCHEVSVEYPEVVVPVGSRVAWRVVVGEISSVQSVTFSLMSLSCSSPICAFSLSDVPAGEYSQEFTNVQPGTKTQRLVFVERGSFSIIGVEEVEVTVTET